MNQSELLLRYQYLNVAWEKYERNYDNLKSSNWNPKEIKKVQRIIEEIWEQQVTILNSIILQ